MKDKKDKMTKISFKKICKSIEDTLSKKLDIRTKILIKTNIERVSFQIMISAFVENKWMTYDSYLMISFIDGIKSEKEYIQQILATIEKNKIFDSLIHKENKANCEG